MERPTIIIWKISCIDRQTRQMFERELELDTQTLSPTEAQAVVEATRTPQILEYRHLFGERAEQEDWPDTHDFHAFALENYHEDHAGNYLTVNEFLDALSGQTGGLVLGDLEGVLRIGPTAMRNQTEWTTGDANLVAHFLEVVDVLRGSEWIKKQVTLKWIPSVNGPKILDFQRPDIYTLYTVLVLIRQLCTLNRDRLFQCVCEKYLHHCSDTGKANYVQFESDLDRYMSAGNTCGIKNSELLDRFFYAVGLIHKPSNAAEIQEFKQIISKFGVERTFFEFHGVLAVVVGKASHVAKIIAQDFQHWTLVEGHHGADRVSLQSLLGE